MLQSDKARLSTSIFTVLNLISIGMRFVDYDITELLYEIFKFVAIVLLYY